MCCASDRGHEHRTQGLLGEGLDNRLHMWIPGRGCFDEWFSHVLNMDY